MSWIKTNNSLLDSALVLKYENCLGINRLVSCFDFNPRLSRYSKFHVTDDSFLHRLVYWFNTWHQWGLYASSDGLSIKNRGHSSNPIFLYRSSNCMNWLYGLWGSSQKDSKTSYGKTSCRRGEGKGSSSAQSSNHR